MLKRSGDVAFEQETRGELVSIFVFDSAKHLHGDGASHLLAIRFPNSSHAAIGEHGSKTIRTRDAIARFVRNTLRRRRILVRNDRSLGSDRGAAERCDSIDSNRLHDGPRFAPPELEPP